MAKFKQSTRTQSAGKRADAQAQAAQLSSKLGESAQQVWLAGVGAFARAQAEGTKLFETLVKEGSGLEQTARRFAGDRADVVRGAVESRVDQARERASDTWDRLEKVFEDRVQRALETLGVPARKDLADLSERVDALTAELRKRGSGARRAAQAAKRTADAKASAHKQATRKTAARSSGTPHQPAGKRPAARRKAARDA